MKITIKTDFKEAQSILKSIRWGFTDFRKPLRDLEKMQLKETDEAFKVVWKNITWKSWKSLKPATVRQKLKLGLNKRILERTWKMRKWFKRKRLESFKLEIWNNITYFAQHQLWYQDRFKKVPQRQMLWHGNLMIKKTEIIKL